MYLIMAVKQPAKIGDYGSMLVPLFNYSMEVEGEVERD